MVAGLDGVGDAGCGGVDGDVSVACGSEGRDLELPRVGDDEPMRSRSTSPGSPPAKSIRCTDSSMASAGISSKSASPSAPGG